MKALCITLLLLFSPVIGLIIWFIFEWIKEKLFMAWAIIWLLVKSLNPKVHKEDRSSFRKIAYGFWLALTGQLK